MSQKAWPQSDNQSSYLFSVSEFVRGVRDNCLKQSHGVRVHNHVRVT